jgi:hypothetical protein
MECQREDLKTGQSFQHKRFDVSPNTNALSIAFQSNLTGNDTRFSPTKFRGYQLIDGSNYQSEEQQIQELYIQYAGQSKPAEHFETDFKGTKNYMRDIYARALMDSLALRDTGGVESEEQFFERGLFTYQEWAKSGKDESTQVDVNVKFQDSVNDLSLLLFSHSASVIKVKIEGGKVVDVAELSV